MPASANPGSDHRAYRPQIAKLTRSELEDEFHKIFDENQTLKQKVNTQNEKMKQLAAKVVKTRGTRSEKDVDTEELVKKVAELEKHNQLLKNKLQSARHQLTAYAKIPLAPNFKAYSGSKLSRIKKNVWQMYPSRNQTPALTSSVNISPPQPIPPTPLPQHSQSSPDFHIYEQTISDLQEQIQMYDQELSLLKDTLQTKHAELEEANLKLKSHQSSHERGSIQENIELIRIQRQLREKSTEAAQVQAKCSKAEQDLRTLKNNYDSLLAEFDQLNTQVRTEQNRNAQLQAQVNTMQKSQGANEYHIKEELENVKRENQAVREVNEKLMSNVFSGGKENHWIEQEKKFRARISDLENAIKSDVNTRNEILEKLATEISTRERLEEEFRKLEVRNLQIKAEAENATKKIARLTQGGISWSEIEEALAVIRTKKEKEGLTSEPLSFLTSLLAEDAAEKDTRSQLERLRVSHAETVQELEQTRNMLLTQYNINQKTQKEIELVQQKAEHHKQEYERHLKQFSDQLDERALRIQRLEAHLRDLAYGRRPFKVLGSAADTDTEGETLEPGQNLLDLHFSKLVLTTDAVKWMQSAEPSVFLTVEFFDFEIQFTPVMKGPNISTDFTSQYAVTVSDLFLHFLQTDSMTVELHQAVGTVYRTWAAGPISLRSLLSGDGKLFGNLELFGVSSGSAGILFGRLEFSVNFKVPFEKSLSLYKERVKALGYIFADQPDSGAAQIQANNQLQITIHRCKGLRPRTSDQSIPSSYAMYQLMDFEEHDTSVVRKNSNPEFADKKTWPIPIDSEVHSYLRTKSLQFMVFDDDGPTDEYSFIGAASVPLLPLIHDKPITGSFQLFLGDPAVGGAVGTIELSILWQYTYIPPKEELLISHPLVELEPEKDLPAPEPQREDESIEKISAVKVVGVKKQRILPTADPELRPEKADEEKTLVTIDENIPEQPTKDEISSEGSPSPVEPRGRSGSYTITKAEPENRGSLEEDAEPSDESEPEPVAPPRKPARVSSFKEPPPYFEDKPVAQEEQRRRSSEESTEEDEDVVVAAPAASSLGGSSSAPGVVRFEILSLSLPPASELLKADHEKVFVEWRFLDLPNEDCETPDSVTLPRNPNEVALFDCVKKIDMTPKRLDLLKKFMKSNGELTFTLVSDPGTDPAAECVDLCAGTVNLQNLLDSGKDIRNATIPLLSEQKVVVANLRMTILILHALRASAQ